MARRPRNPCAGRRSRSARTYCREDPTEVVRPFTTDAVARGRCKRRNPSFILGDILELDHKEASLVLEIEPATFRKRLSRARADLIAFTQAHCGIVKPGNACHCHKRIDHAVQTGRVQPQNPRFAKDLDSPNQFDTVVAEIGNLEESQRLVALYRAQPEFQSGENFAAAVRRLIDMGDVKK